MIFCNIAMYVMIMKQSGDGAGIQEVACGWGDMTAEYHFSAKLYF